MDGHVFVEVDRSMWVGVCPSWRMHVIAGSWYGSCPFWRGHFLVGGAMLLDEACLCQERVLAGRGMPFWEETCHCRRSVLVEGGKSLHQETWL